MHADGGELERLEGLRLREAVCGACGYHIGGAPVERGVVRCPECGHDTVVSPELHRSLLDARRAIAGPGPRATISLLFMIALVTAVFFLFFGWWALLAPPALAIPWLVALAARRAVAR